MADEQAGDRPAEPADGPAGIDTTAEIDTTVAHPARVYDYWLGGTSNFAADREAAERVLAVTPGLRFRFRANRAFLARAVRYLAGEAGIAQFLDIGTGIPSANNTHEVAQAAAQGSRIVYIDNDPIVATHARALLASSAAGSTQYVHADLQDTAAIVQSAARTLDFTRAGGGAAAGCSRRARGGCGGQAGQDAPPGGDALAGEHAEPERERGGAGVQGGVTQLLVAGVQPAAGSTGLAGIRAGARFSSRGAR